MQYYDYENGKFASAKEARSKLGNAMKFDTMNSMPYQQQIMDGMSFGDKKEKKKFEAELQQVFLKMTMQGKFAHSITKGDMVS